MTRKLLNVDANPKTVKGQARGYMTAVLYLAPWKAAGANVCPMAEVAGCVAACLNTAGRGGIARGTVAPYGVPVPANGVQAARIARTEFFLNDRPSFMAQLVKEIRAFIRKAERAGLVPVVRLNGTSDLRWENIAADGKRNIMEVFPAVQFYDYTKIPNRKGLPANYHLSYSASGRPEFAPYMDRAAAAGLNIVAVFRKSLPAEFMGRPVVNGDESDLRFLDPAGVVVGLKAKGRARRDVSGFVFP